MMSRCTKYFRAPQKCGAFFYAYWLGNVRVGLWNWDFHNPMSCRTHEGISSNISLIKLT